MIPANPPQKILCAVPPRKHVGTSPSVDHARAPERHTRSLEADGKEPRARVAAQGTPDRGLEAPNLTRSATCTCY